MSKEKLLELVFGSEDIEIGGEVYQVKEMTVEESTEYESALVSMVNGKAVYDLKSSKKKLVLLTLWQDGKRVFEDKDIGIVEKLPYSVLNQVFKVASRLNKLDGAENIKN